MLALLTFLNAALVLLTFEAFILSRGISTAHWTEKYFESNQVKVECGGPESPSSHASCEKDFTQKPVSMSTSLALVPFDEGRVLPHEKTVREFSLAGHVFTIKQDWNSLGVAAVVWDSAVVLGEYLVMNEASVKGKNVLELGAGTGLTGLVAAALGANVTVTEREEALPNLRATVDQNCADKSWVISATKLDWTQPVDDSDFPAVDLIIGADVIYIEETFQDLLRTILSLAKSDQTHVLLSCKIRYDRDLRFLNLLRNHFKVNEIFYDKNRDIKIFSVVRFS
ncbi:hypothetical protein EGW08_007296 [Elysia chlorotica]|uniref:Methyltransferase small domain-containing protein n=1 Tax=Elysia chlorotica TaxID=188477 RepID=A0A433TTQ0_ELYCH|nr:hypothetical protein EGW08_007296 [Elysia chlorotica]